MKVIDNQRENLIYRDKDWLRQKYWDEKLSMTQMGVISAVSKSTISRWMRRWQIPKRETKRSMNEYLHEDPQWLKEKYWAEGLTLKEIGCIVNRNGAVILYWMKKYNIPRRRAANERTKRKLSNAMSGKKNKYWRGGRQNHHGYITRHRDSFTLEEQEILNPMFQKSTDKVLEHRAFIALKLGRPLTSEEQVHHINKVRSDNQSENLRLVNHHRESICPRCGWSMEGEHGQI